MRSILLGSLLMLMALPALAQDSVVLVPGARVWVKSLAWSGRLIGGPRGTVRAIAGDTLFLEGADSTSITPVPLDSRSRVFIWTGTTSGAGRGAALGAGLGLVAGGVIGYLSGEDCSGDEWLCFGRPMVAMAGGLAGAGVGAIVGLMAGSSTRVDQWTPLEPDRQGMRLIIQPGGERWRIGARVAFE